MKNLVKWTLTTASMILMLTVTEGARHRSLIKTCPEGYQLLENPLSGKAECTCLPYHLYWPGDGLCYKELTQGPCKPGHKLVWNGETESAECQCPPFWTRITPDGECYEEYTQGPCQKGRILIQGQCTCSRNLTMHYHPGTEQCFELYSRGPCSAGKVLNFNYRTLRPECVCRDHHIEWTDGNCYPVNTPSAGPCDSSQCPPDTPVSCFVSDVDSLSVSTARCSCLPKASLVDEGTRCYPSYNQGPCEYGHWLVYNRTSSPQSAKCLPKKNCQRFDNWYWWPEDGNCYKQWRQGPCPLGELFYLDPDTGVTSCLCRPTWHKHLYNGKCYEHHSVGPCPAGQYFAFDSAGNRTACSCFTAFAPDLKRNICVEKMTRDTCKLGELVTADEKTGEFKCDCQKDKMKENYWPQDGKCYQHFTQGPCGNSLLFRLDERTKLPACLPPITSSSASSTVSRSSRLLQKRQHPFVKLFSSSAF